MNLPARLAAIALLAAMLSSAAGPLGAHPTPPEIDTLPATIRTAAPELLAAEAEPPRTVITILSPAAPGEPGTILFGAAEPGQPAPSAFGGPR